MSAAGGAFELERPGVDSDPDEATGADYEDAVQMHRQLGDEVMTAFGDPDVTGMYVNPDGRVWTVSYSRGHSHAGLRLGAFEVEGFLNLAAARLGEIITPQSPTLQGELPKTFFGGARLQGVIPPITAAPVFVVRKLPRRVFPLESYRDRRELSFGHYDAIMEAISENCSIAVGGPTNSGKSTFLNAMIRAQVRQNSELTRRIFVIEDTAEVKSDALNTVSMRTSPDLDLEGCLYVAMRMDPASLHVGEIRNLPKGAAFAMLDGWSTGHPGFCTIHSHTAQGTYERLGRLAGRASGQDEGWLVAGAVHRVIQISPTNSGRQVTAVAKCEEYRDGRYIVTPL